MKHIAIICDTANEFHQFVSNLIGQEEYSLCIKSNFQICHELTKYCWIGAPAHAMGRVWDYFYVPQFDKFVSIIRERMVPMKHEDTRFELEEVAKALHEGTKVPLFEQVEDERKVVRFGE